MFESATAWVGALALVAAAAALVAAVQRAGRPPFSIGWLLLALGGTAELLYMGLVSARLQTFPIVSPWMGASFLSVLVTAFAGLVWLRYREPAFLVGAAPVAALFALVAAVGPNGPVEIETVAAKISILRPDIPDAGHRVLQSWWFPAHVTLAFAAYAMFALAATMGLLQLALLRALKRKTALSQVRFLPPLPIVERVGTLSVFVGMATLLVALIIGAFGANWVLNSHWLGDPKEISGLTILAIYAGIESLRATLRWTGRRTAVAHVGAFLALLAVFLGSSALAPKVHGF